MRQVYIENYGCSANLNNTEIMKGILNKAGYIIASKPDKSDIIIINTCVVKGKTESKIKRRIQDLSGKFKDKLIIISGCMSIIDNKSLKKINPKLFFLGLNNIKNIADLIEEYYSKQSINDFKKYISDKNEEKLLVPKIPENKIVSITQISTGCLGKCSFCRTKLAKGNLFTFDINNIVKSIENDLNNGCKEIWLTSQDCAAYGMDKGKNNLPDLLNKIFSINRNFKLRLGMMNPNNVLLILNDLIKAYKNPKIFKFIHIPIQSASNRLLQQMNRFYNIEDAKFIINEFRKNFPDITIATDIITGYPTETEKEHIQNLKFIEEIQPEVLNLSKFSSHKDTESGKLIPLDKKIINKRALEIMDLHRKTAFEKKKKFLGKFINVFVDKKTNIKDVFESRDDNYNIILIKSIDDSILGKTLKARIVSHGVHHMNGEIIA